MNTGETVRLDFVSGVNPFTGIAGYNSDGFTLGTDSLTFDSSFADATDFSIDFGLLAQDEIFLTAGTVLALSADPAVGGGISLASISIARPLDAINEILEDYDLDGAIDEADLTVWNTSFGSTTALEADGNGDGVVSGADFLLWQRNFTGGTTALASAKSVPEPSSILMTFLLAIVVLNCRSEIENRKLIPPHYV